MTSSSVLQATRARLRLPTARLATRALEGVHPTRGAGRGFDFDQLAPYQPGEDIGLMDWAATARAGAPMTRRFLTMTSAPLVLVADTGRPMAAISPAGTPKARIALEAAHVMSYLALLRSDPVGLLHGNAASYQMVPVRGGNTHVDALLHELSDAYHIDAPAPNLSALCDRLPGYVRRRSIVMILTDLPQAGQAARQIAALRTRYSVYLLLAEDANPAGFTKRQVADVSLGPLDATLLDTPGAARAATEVAQRFRAAALARLNATGVPNQSVGHPEAVIDALHDLFARPT